MVYTTGCDCGSPLLQFFSQDHYCFVLLPEHTFQGVTDEDKEEQDSKAADEAEMTGQTAPDKLRAELKRRKKEADQ